MKLFPKVGKEGRVGQGILQVATPVAYVLSIPALTIKSENILYLPLGNGSMLDLDEEIKGIISEII